jgi:serine/threonine protein kinase
MEEFPGVYMVTLAGDRGRLFHPVVVGDIYSHYRVIRKLGHGGLSTVWLAEDLKSTTYVTWLIC